MMPNPAFRWGRCEPAPACAQAAPGGAASGQKEAKAPPRCEFGSAILGAVAVKAEGSPEDGG